uniref:Uncharacterized protein n=1 Tax=Salmo trutta TaxID=8032 RepID=A0A674BPI5_SALTR
MNVMIVLLRTTLCFEVRNAQCREPNRLKEADSVKFCACILEDSHYYCEHICAGEYLDAYPPTGHALGCSLTVWDYTKKRRSRSKFMVGIKYHLKDVMQNLSSWGKDISGYYCVC